MQSKKRYQLSQGLFFLSLLLLGSFLGFWLYAVYEEEADDLEDQVNYIWVKSVQDASSGKWVSAFSEFVELDSGQRANIVIKTDEDNKDKHNVLHFSRSIDLEVDSFSSMEELNKELADTNLNKVMKMMLSLGNDKGELKHEKLVQALSIDRDSLREDLNKGLRNEVLEVTYEVVELAGDSLPKLMRTQERLYKNPLTGEQLFMELNISPWAVLRRMWWELLIAFLLFGSIATAFYYILHSLKKQRQLVQIKNDLISNITHELRTPIFTVSAALEALQNFNAMDDPEKTKEYLKISQAELNRLSILVEKVLKTSVFEDPVAQLQMESLNVVALSKTIEASLQLLLERNEAELEIDCNQDQIFINADKIHLTNVIYNLIDNALKYNDKKPKLKLSIKDLGTKVELSLQDNGMGIEEKYQKQLFERFFRVPTGNKHNVKGYGLGLNYVAGVIKKHDGNIELSSKVGEGTTFRIYLPK
jgi:two-component system phosphate regulon sensor histidine kinase PhoR